MSGLQELLQNPGAARRRAKNGHQVGGIRPDSSQSEHQSNMAIKPDPTT